MHLASPSINFGEEPMTDKSDAKQWASNSNLLIVITECVIIALMTLRYLNPAVAAIVIVLMLGGYLISVFGPGARGSSTQFASSTGQPGNSAV
jgi:hypothetical protein